MELSELIEKQKRVFKDGDLKNVELRKEILKKLKRVIKENEEEILKALQKDLNKSDFEAYMTEIYTVYEEINFLLKNVSKWSKRKRVKGAVGVFKSDSYIYSEPYGSVLIIGSFNYPFQLIFAPLIGAIAGGNTAVIKPSEYCKHTSKLIADIINNNFEDKYIKVVGYNKGKEIVEELLEQRFDYIFFTGSIRVGKIVMEKASKNLIPVTLELGGKSPCIVDENANLKMAAKRIVWGKLVNCGQTCVAPDYLFVNKKVVNEFLPLLKKEIEMQYGRDIRKNNEYPRIINEREFNRIISYIDEGEVYYGGNHDINDLFIQPTILTNIDKDANVLTQEIFGPILPILEFEKLDEVITYVNDREKPLALYYFSEDNNNIEYILKNTSSGGVCINDTIMHLSTSFLPFGGVGSSGMGSYHGKASFDTFTHSKSVLKSSTKVNVPLRFAPFKDKIKWLRKLG